MSDKRGSFIIVTEGITADDFLLNLKNGMGIRKIMQGKNKLYERESSFVYIEFDSHYGENASVESESI